ncbi:MAG: acyltransferase [Burkholderiaceae bacterium]
MNSSPVVNNPRVVLGVNTRVSPDVEFIFHRDSRITIGDNCIINSGVKFVCDGGDVSIDDWSTLHDRCLVLSSQGVKIGQHCWFGQNSIIDGTGGMTIGNGVRVGMYSQLWSHVAAGEQMEGCTLYGRRPVTIEDDVWLVGSCIVASGLTLGRRSIALIGSNITRSTAPATVVAGSPATVKPGLEFYKTLGLDEKWAMLQSWLHEIATEQDLLLDEISAGVLRFRTKEPSSTQELFFACSSADAAQLRQEFAATVCCVEDKRYNKRLTPLECRVLKNLAGNRARFYRLEK